MPRERRTRSVFEWEALLLFCEWEACTKNGRRERERVMRGDGAGGDLWDVTGEEACLFRRLYRGAGGDSGSNLESTGRRCRLRLRLWRVGEEGGEELEGPADGSEKLPGDNMEKCEGGIAGGDGEERWSACDCGSKSICEYEKISGGGICESVSICNSGTASIQISGVSH